MEARILIVDDHEVVRHGVRAILQKCRPEWEICGEATDGKEAIQAVKTLQPNVVILDITMPLMSGLEAAAHIGKLAPRTRILIFTMHESERINADVSRVGAHGYVQKTEAGRDLIQAIEMLLAGGTFFGPKSKADPEAAKQQNPDVSFCRAVQVGWMAWA
jgi:DNA-binding NarL/FixJ family response regulator